MTDSPKKLPPLTSYDSTLSNSSPEPPKLISFSQIQEILTTLLSSPETTESILLSQAKAYNLVASSTCDNDNNGKCSNLPIQTAGQPPNPHLLSGPEAQMCIKTGYASNDSVIVSKVAAGGGSYPNTGTVFVYSQTTLRLQCLLCDEGLLTEVRTAAAAAYVTRAAIRRAGGASKVKKVGLVGGGTQAVWQLRLLSACGAIDTKTVSIVVKTKSRESAEAFVKKMKQSEYPPDREFQFEFYEEGGERFRGCQVVYTLTPSRKVVLCKEDVSLPRDGDEEHSFLHISAIGSDSPGKYEVATELLSLADFSLVDLADQSRERGEFQSSRWEGLSSFPTLFEVGQVGVIDENNGMLSLKSILKDADGKGLFTVFDSSGLAMQDVQMTSLISKHL